ncbi:hypothetical protein B5X24_HaOG213034 [Helicoverpa armigera]|nr:hypothetical protein B5X24_HaOG213034 [Helicoverpa armigera]
MTKQIFISISLRSLFFLLLFCHNSSQLFSGKKSPWKVAFVLVEMENVGKIKEKAAYVLRARNFGVMIAGRVDSLCHFGVKKSFIFLHYIQVSIKYEIPLAEVHKGKIVN